MIQGIDIQQNIKNALAAKINLTEIELEVPPDASLGDYAFPCFAIAKSLKKSPVQIALELSKTLSIEGIENIEANGPYLNFFVDRALFCKCAIETIHKQKDKYGSAKVGKNKSIVIDYSSPNIAKPFGIAHIRSTVIGNSLYKIHKFLGYKVVRVNHLGDWGTQFGKLIVAYKKWGDEKKLEKDGIGHLVDMYIQFGEEAEINPALEDDARFWFKKLEDGDKEALSLWELFREISLIEFRRYYKKLAVDFDTYHGESFYNDKLDSTIKQVQHKVPAEIDQGALIVRLDGMPPVILRKSDGASTYHTRDIAAAVYRLKEYNPEKILYIVGSPQSLHFNQLFAVLGKMDYNKEKFVHVQFGNMTYEGMMMSTRTGNFILLEEVLHKAVELALQTIMQKSPSLRNKKKVAEAIGIGAVIFGDLVNDRARDVDFTWEKALDFEGETGPYLQYTHARICSLLKKAGRVVDWNVDYHLLTAEKEVISILHHFPEVVLETQQNYKPHIIARYLIEMAQKFNSYYQNNPILNQKEDLRNARLAVAQCVGIVLKNGLSLLGLEAPVTM